ncbi:uncharacterized protein LOC132799426 [Ziziphus jujuba]|uniref:Uncharacterized protein LOC132799426 n=1 Tax=Ziziphus jujuba TaxID=326968 RepID=A0ABM3ZRW3_ZIZJJ|nr:uncharacterized protein LOC132799426 [Ziziphus jujuba]
MFWVKNDQEDKVIWTATKSSSFTIKSAYNLEEEGEESDVSWWKHLWKSKIHERTKFFLWQLANALLSNLADRGVTLDNLDCAYGCNCVENEVHVFLQCEVVRRLSFASPWGIRWEESGINDIMSMLKCSINPMGTLPVHSVDKEYFIIFSAITLEHLWWLRNNVVHKGKDMRIELSLEVESNALSPINAIKENDISNLHWAAEPIASQEIYELIDPNGLPLSFGFD